MNIHPLVAASVTVAALAAQQPSLQLNQNSLLYFGGPTTLSWNVGGLPGDTALLFADVVVARTNVFGVDFDLGASPVLLQVGAGIGTGSLTFDPAILPANLPIYLQAAVWNPNLGLGSLRASNVESVVSHIYRGAFVQTFQLPANDITGRFDTSVTARLQAAPPTIHTVHPTPPGGIHFGFPATQINPLHPSGARHQMALRAADLGADGSPMQLTAVRWLPTSGGTVVNENYQQIEIRAAHASARPDYTIDIFSALPAFPLSGLDETFANNPRPGAAPVLVYSGPYAIAPAQQQPNGYMPFPPLQQPFVYDSDSTLLLETRCLPQPGLASPGNTMELSLMVTSSAQPFGTVAANGGFNGQPLPLVPANAARGTGGSYVFDLELEFVRTHSVAITPFSPPSLFRDWQPAIVCGATPAGSSIHLEFRGRNGATLTAWSPSPDIADGMDIQVRITMVADAATGAVPWIDTLIVPAI